MLPSSTHPFPPFLPCHKAESPENQLEGLCCKLPNGIHGKAKQTHFGVFWAWKLHLAATFLAIYLSFKWCTLKNSCFGKKCQNGVKKNSRTSFQCVPAQFKLWLLIQWQEGHLACIKPSVGIFVAVTRLELCTFLSSSCQHCHVHHPTICVKPRMVWHLGTGLRRLSWNTGH